MTTLSLQRKKKEQQQQLVFQLFLFLKRWCRSNVMCVCVCGGSNKKQQQQQAVISLAGHFEVNTGGQGDVMTLR